MPLGADVLLAAAVGVVVTLAHLSTDLIASLERRFYDSASTWAAPEPSDRIVVVAVDDASIARLGRWPWARDVHARLIDRLAEGRPRAIVHTTLFLEPQADRGLDYIRRIQRAAGSGGPVATLAAEAEVALDADRRLAASLRQAGNVLLPAVLTLGDSTGRPETAVPGFASRIALRDPGARAPAASRGQFPIEGLGAAAAAVGHLNLLPDADGVSRADPMLVQLDGQGIPSLALLAAAAGLRLAPSDIGWQADGRLTLGKKPVLTDEHGIALSQFYPAVRGQRPFPVDAAHEVLSGQVPPSRYTDRIVVIGATAAGVGLPLATPGYPALSPPERLAHVVSSLMADHGFVRPAWAPFATIGLVVLVIGYLAALLPRLGAAAGASFTALALATLLTLEWLLLAGGGVWLPLVFPAILLLLGHLALTTRRFLVTEAGKRQSDDESAEAHRMMGLALLGQGDLDMAFDRFRRVPLGPALMENLYQLALDFERRRQFNKAESVYAHMATHDPGYKDLPERRERVRRAADAALLGLGTLHPGGTLVLDDPALEMPVLGRYRVDKVLGQGAMGMVYLGHDPKIGRPLAIKTLALSQAFEGAALAEARQRFFREAETAGRLAHPHIVTVFDAGEEQDLAYIAMEFVQGEDLSAHSQPGQLLPARQVAGLGVQVARALDHAHRQGVIHRDIKPGNLLWSPETGQVKVSDFGIARLADQSRTRTGTLLGTPGYMAPEQIAGQPVDGRSDLYALGATLFQLLTGALPFQAESITELLYKITHQPAPDLRSLRPDLPAALAEVIAQLLRKSADERPADGAAVAAALEACLATWAQADVVDIPVA